MTPRHPTAIRIEVEKAFDDSNLIDYACAEIERLERALSDASIAWKPVADGLPDDDITVLVVRADDDDVWAAYHDGDDGWRDTTGWPMTNVTHWAHMPKGPK